MNILRGKITDITSEGSITLVGINVEGVMFYSLILNGSETFSLFKGKEVYILFKETEVSIGKGIKGEISLSNQIKATVINIEKGKILSLLKLKFKGQEIKSIITTKSLERLNIKINDEVIAFIKANEVSIMEKEDV